MSNWTFITNHGAVLSIISQYKRITAFDISKKLDITERSVRRVIADLVEEGYIEPMKERGVNRYQINTSLALRRPEMKDLKVKELLRCLSLSKRKTPSSSKTKN